MALHLYFPNEPALVHCPTCAALKPRDAFAVNRSRKNGLKSQCRACIKAARSKPDALAKRRIYDKRRRADLYIGYIEQCLRADSRFLRDAYLPPELLRLQRIQRMLRRQVRSVLNAERHDVTG